MRRDWNLKGFPAWDGVCTVETDSYIAGAALFMRGKRPSTHQKMIIPV